MIFRALTYLIFTIILFITLSLTKITYNYSDFKDYSEVLLNVSGMVFTIMGLWIAFIYPNALNRLVNPSKISIADFSETREDTKRLEALVASVLKSALIVTIVMLAFLAKVILYKTHFYSDYAENIKSVALAIFITLSTIQVESI